MVAGPRCRDCALLSPGTVEGKGALEVGAGIIVLSFCLVLQPGPRTAASPSPSRVPVLDPGVFCPPVSFRSRPEGRGPDCSVGGGRERGEGPRVAQEVVPCQSQPVPL